MKTSLLIVLLSASAFAQTDELLAQIAKWQSDTSRQPLLALSQLVQKAPAAQRPTIEQKFIAFLKSDATLAGKDFVSKQLSLIGTEASVPVLAGMLLDPKTADMGRYALERIPGPATDRALRDALTKTSGNTQIGIINTIGERRDSGAVPLLRALAHPAALYALAKIADPAALETLGEAYAKNPGAADAYLQSANRLTPTAAFPIYTKLYAASNPPIIRAAALRGLAASGGAPSSMLTAALRGNDLGLQAAAVDAMMPNSSAQLIAEILNLSEAAQVRVLGLLSERANASALPAFTNALKSASKPVRLAALQGIGPVANASAVAPLATIAAADDPAEQTAARAALVRIRGREADQAIASSISSAPPKVKRELIRAAGERGASVAAPSLLAAARDPDTDVRRESLRALATVGTANEISGLVALVVTPVPPDDRTESSRALGAILRRSDSARIKDVLTAYTSSTGEIRTALLRVMGQSGNPEALIALRAALKDSDAEVKRSAILALTEWPDTTPVPDLFETARTASAPAHQTLALRGAIQLIGLPNPARPHIDSAKLLAEAASLAKQTDEKRSILSLVVRYPVKESLEIADALLKDPTVANEAKVAVSRLERTVRR